MLLTLITLFGQYMLIEKGFFVGRYVHIGLEYRVLIMYKCVDLSATIRQTLIDFSNVFRNFARLILFI